MRISEEKLYKFVYERTQLTQGDAEDFAWDLMDFFGASLDRS